MIKVSLTKLDEVFAAIAGEQKLYIPVDREGGADYKEWQEGLKISTSLNTVRSAKDFFFPQHESLVEFKVEGKKIEVIDPRREVEDFVIFGVRACDAKSFELLDKVYLAEPVDTYYKNKREHGTIVTLACTAPEETCFCTAFGIDPVNPAGDVSAWAAGENIYFKANTEKGEKLLAVIEGLSASADESEIEEAKNAISAIMAKLPIKNLDLDIFKAEDATQKFFDSEKWAELSESCIACGTCTFVCPTCQCYDIKDFDTGHGIKRFRCWDSCMYSDFTKCAHGNPRTTQLQRFRQRFMHKLVYFPANNNGEFSCVGCGRCLQKCPISMNIVKVIKALGGTK